MAMPVQVWNPFLWVSPLDDTFSRDWQRAQREWRGEEHIWLDPDVTAVKRWVLREENVLPIYECLVPSESINGFSVIHIDEGRRVHPFLPLPDEWQNTLPLALYKQWLGTLPDLIEGRDSIPLIWPVVSNDNVSYKECNVHVEPGPMLNITSVHENDGSFTSAWPPPNIEAPPTISPEMESRRLYGQLRRTTMMFNGKEMNIVVSDKDPKVKAFNFWQRWREPFHIFFPTGGGSDLLLHHAAMRTCIKNLEQGQRDEARRRAEVWVNRLTGEAETSLERSWFMPKVWTDPESVLVEVEGKFNLPFDDLDMLIQSKEFLEILKRPVKVRRVQGWLGYFWWELYQDIITNVTIRFCTQCGNILRGGHTDRQYCTRQENLACYRKRNTQQQQRVRKGKPKR